MSKVIHFQRDTGHVMLHDNLYCTASCEKRKQVLHWSDLIGYLAFTTYFYRCFAIFLSASHINVFLPDWPTEREKSLIIVFPVTFCFPDWLIMRATFFLRSHGFCQGQQKMLLISKMLKTNRNIS